MESFCRKCLSWHECSHHKQEVEPGSHREGDVGGPDKQDNDLRIRGETRRQSGEAKGHAMGRGREDGAKQRQLHRLCQPRRGRPPLGPEGGEEEYVCDWDQDRCHAGSGPELMATHHRPVKDKKKVQPDDKGRGNTANQGCPSCESQLLLCLGHSLLEEYQEEADDRRMGDQ